MKVNECMCNNVTWVTPETSICECANLMAEHKIGCIPVLIEVNIGNEESKFGVKPEECIDFIEKASKKSETFSRERGETI